MFDSIINVIDCAKSALTKERCISTILLKSGLALLLKDEGVEVTNLNCSDNQVAMQFKMPDANLKAFKATGVIDVILSDPVVNWPNQTVSFTLASKVSIESGLLKRIVGALVVGMLETLHGEHAVLAKVLADHDEVSIVGNQAIVHLDKLPYQLKDIPMLGSMVQLKSLYFKDNGAYIKAGLG